MLDKLPDLSDQALHGLQADEALKARILTAALSDEKPSPRFRRSVRLIPVLLSSVAVLVLCVFLLNGKKPLSPQEQSPLIQSFSAGDGLAAGSVPSFAAFASLPADSVVSLELRSRGAVVDRGLIVSLLDALKNPSDVVSGDAASMEDSLTVVTVDGLTLTLPAQAPCVAWSDGVRRCDRFFDLFAPQGD